MSSAQMAESVGTNPSFVRKILGFMKRAHLIESNRGRAGFKLKVPPSEITLLEIHESIFGPDEMMLFCMHKNPNDECIVGRHIKSTLSSVFEQVQRQAEKTLASTMLSDCVEDMRSRIETE